MSSIFSAQSCLSVLNAQIHLSEFYQSGEHWGLAVYTSTNTLILIHSKLRVSCPEKPQVFVAPWHMQCNGPEIVAMAFHPLGLRLVAATSAGTLVLMRTKEDVVGSTGPGFLPPHLEIDLNPEQCSSRAITKVVWWETVDGQHMIIVGTWTAGLVVVDLRLGKAVASVAVPEPVEDLGLFWSGSCGRRLLLITGSRGSQWFLPLETKSKRLWPSVRVYQQQLQAGSTSESKPSRPAAIMPRGIRRGASCTDRRHHQVAHQHNQHQQQQQQQDENSAAAAGAVGHRSSIAGWRQFSTEKLIGIKQRVADWNPLGAGRSKSFLGFAQEEDENAPESEQSSHHYAVISGEDGWKAGQIPASLEPLDVGDAGRDLGPFRLCSHYSGPAETGAKLGAFSEFVSELRLIDLDRTATNIDSAFKVKPKFDPSRSAWTPTVVFRVSSRPDSETPPQSANAGSSSSSSSYMNPSMYVPNPGSAVPHHRMLPPPSALLSTSSLAGSSPQLTIHSCHLTKCAVEESVGGGVGGGKGQKGGGKAGLKWFNKSTRSNSVAFSNGHLPHYGPPSPTEMPEVTQDLERSSSGVTVTKVAKKRVYHHEDERESNKKNGDVDVSSGGIQSWRCTKRGEVIVRIFPLDSSVLEGKTDELRPADFEKGGIEDDTWMTYSMLPPSDKETWIHWCLVVTNTAVTLLFVPFSLERIILKNLVCKKPANRAVEDARAIANAFASALEANGGVARVFYTAMDIFLSHNDLQSAVLMLRGGMGTSLEDAKRLLVRKCVVGAMTCLSIELGELGQPGNLHTASNARQMQSLQHLCRIHQYLVADKETEKAKNLLAQVKRCFWEPRTEWPIVVLRGLIEARMWNMAAEYAAIHGMGRYFLEFSGYKGIELTEKPFRGSDGGDFKRTLPSLTFSNVLAFSSKWRRVHTRWFRQCLASGSFGNRDNQDATDVLMEFCELFDPTRPNYRALWLQQGNEKKIEQRFYSKLRLKVGFVPRLPSQSCPIREIFVWRIAGGEDRTKSRSPSPGLLSAGKIREPRRRKQRPPHGAEIIENFLLALLTRQALCNASTLRYRQSRFAPNRRLDGLDEEEDDDDSEYEYFCDEDEDDDDVDDHSKGISGGYLYKRMAAIGGGAGGGGRRAPMDAGRRQSIAVARRRFRRKLTTSIFSLVGSSSDSSSSDDDSSAGHHHPHHRHHHRSGHEEDQPPIPMTAAGVRDDVKRRRAVMTDDGVRDAFRRQISAGHSHAACTTGDNNVRVWGSALDGFIGLNRFDSAPCMPAVVPLFEKLKLKVVAVACGRKHTLALTSVGVFSWGDGSFGQLGLGPNILRTADPVLVEKLIPHTIEGISAGQYHSLATTRDGKVFSFGWGIHGQLGHGSVENLHIPTMVQSLAHAGLIVRKSCGGHAHSLFLCHVPPPGASASTFTAPPARNMYSHLYHHSNPPGSDEHQPTTLVVACGNGAFGQLGTLDVKKSLVPIVVPLPAQLTTTSIVAGTNTGTVEGAPVVTLTTTSIDRVVDIDTSYFFNLALTRRGRVFRWGVSPHAMRWELNQFKPKLSALLGVRRNNNGNVTNGAQPGAQTAPQNGPQKPESIEAGLSRSNNQPAGQQGAPGYGKLTRQETLSKLTRKKFSSIMRKNPQAAPEATTADTDGSWTAPKKPEEDPNRNSLAVNGNQPAPAHPPGLSDPEKKQGIIFQYFLPHEVDLSSVRGNVVQASAGLYHCLLADDLGTMYGWGRNLHGQLGLSNLTSPALPTPADVPFSVMAVAAGSEFSLMVDHTGAVWSSGNNDCGQLGVKLPLAQPERPLQALLNPQKSSDDQQQNPLVGRVLSLRSNRGRVAFLRQNSVDAFTSSPKQITSLPEIVPISNPTNPADNRVRKKPWFNHMDHYMDEKKLKDICETGIGRYDPFVILVQSVQLGNFLLASQICVINKCWGPACFFALQNCVPATQRTEIKWNLRARDLDPDQPVSKEERRLIRRRSTRLRLGKEAELLKTQEGMLRILFSLEDTSSYPEPNIRENDVDRIGLGCSARATQDERTLKLWASSKEANNNGELDGDANWEEFPEISRVTCEAALAVLKHFVDKIVAEHRKDKEKLFGEFRTIAGIVVRFWVDYGLPVFGLEKLLTEKLHHMAAPIASFVLSEEDPLTCEAFINALTSDFWIRVTKAAMKSGPGVPELEDIVARMTVQGSVPPSTAETDFEDDQEFIEGGETIGDDARNAITIEGSQLTQAVSVSDGESWTPGQTLVKVFSCGHAIKVATGTKDNTPHYSACPDCVQRSQ